MARSKPKVWTKEQILADWKKSARAGLGDAKRLSKDVTDKFDPLLLAKIETRLKEGRNYNKEGVRTRAVARAVGKFCKELTAGRDVSLGVFEAVFKVCQLHPKCPGGGGSGKWCDI